MPNPAPTRGPESPRQPRRSRDFEEVRAAHQALLLQCREVRLACERQRDACLRIREKINIGWLLAHRNMVRFRVLADRIRGMHQGAVGRDVPLAVNRAVLGAANAWVLALRTVKEADDANRLQERHEFSLDAAEMELYSAVLDLRAAAGGRAHSWGGVA